jgi:hypothetical protein
LAHHSEGVPGMATAHAPVVSPHLFRFNLKSLMMVVTVVGILLTPATWFGLPYLLSVAFSAALVICCILAVRQDARGAAFGMSFVAALIGFPIAVVFMVFFFHAFFNLIACGVLLLVGVRARIYATVTTGLAVAVYVWFIWSGVETLRELAALKLKYPFVSLQERLAFEQNQLTRATSPISQPTLTPAVSNQLDVIEELLERRYYSRAWALKSLHEDTYYQFARAAGFGFSRMPLVHPRTVVLEPRQQVSVPLRLAVKATSPGRQELAPVHSTAIRDFIDPERTGYARNRGEVAGFESHGFSELPQQFLCEGTDAGSWQIRRLELVSLQRHDEPRVYIASTLPQMDQLGDVPHRGLNEFETLALPQLEAAKDVVIEQQPKRIQMLGAVRAATSCLECHEGRRGKLLGAFSYEITPIVDTAQAAR